MTTFDEREQAFEAMFVHNEEMRFKAEARRNKLLGLWAAELLGKVGEAANAYAREVVVADVEESGDDDVFRKVYADLEGKSDAPTIRAKMVELMAEAKRQIASEA